MTDSLLAATPGGFATEALQIAALSLAGVAYARRVGTLTRRGRATPVARQAWFFGGLLILALALASPIRSLDEERLFYAHMIQHLLIGDLAALAIVLGLNGPLLRPVLALPLLRHLRVLAHPLVALPLWTVNLFVWHVPGLYEAALSHGAVHGLQHGLFLTTGALMWAAVVEPLPGPVWFGTGPKALYVLVVRTAGAVLASVFIWASRPFYPWYAAGEGESGVSPVTDQAIGGLIMFVEGSVVTLLAFAWFFLRWLREAELRQRLVDSGHDPHTAARAARYGRSALARTGADRPDRT
ncbi:MAG: cytochrome c oxidase assembly protein [Actinomycetota bacterium]|nr:cytochrome c oxidase assembly protein [Actinomycetota bacterium]